jgi:hypothetical protein
MIRACLNDWKQCVYGDKKFLDSKHGMIIETSEREEERTSDGRGFRVDLTVYTYRRSVATIFNMAHTYVLGPDTRALEEREARPLTR